jgi:hypothetical protein
MNVFQQVVRRSLWASMSAAAILVAGCATMSSSGGTDVTLRGSQEVPPVTTAASGSGTITVGADKSVSGSVTTAGINATAAHIHMAAMGQNGPVVIPLTKTADGVWSVPAGVKLTTLSLMPSRPAISTSTCTATPTKAARSAAS